MSDLAAGLARRRNPAVFVVGCPRSGTTLLQRMLDHHPRLAVANDTHFVPRFLDADAERAADQPLTPELIHAVRTYRRFPRLGLDDAMVDAAATGAATYVDFVSRLYDQFAHEHGKTLAGEKTPDYVRHLPALHNHFPWSRFVHIIRDGREVALSTLEWATPTKGPGRMELWREEPIAVCALWWRRNVSMGRRDGAALGNGYREVRYDTLVADPERELAGLAEFLELPDAPEMAQYHVGRTRNAPGLSPKSAWLPPTTGLRDWREDLAPRDLALFEALAGDLLSELGYELAHPRPPAGVADVADRCRAWWANRRWRRESGSRSEPLPRPEPTPTESR